MRKLEADFSRVTTLLPLLKHTYTFLHKHIQTHLDSFTGFVRIKLNHCRSQ